MIFGKPLATPLPWRKRPRTCKLGRHDICSERRHDIDLLKGRLRYFTFWACARCGKRDNTRDQREVFVPR